MIKVTIDKQEMMNFKAAIQEAGEICDRIMEDVAELDGELTKAKESIGRAIQIEPSDIIEPSDETS